MKGSPKLGHSGYGYQHSGGGIYAQHNNQYLGSGYGYSSTGQSGYGNQHTAPAIHVYGSGNTLIKRYLLRLQFFI